MIEWFQRLADVPGVDYTGDRAVRRSTLAGHDAVPRTVSHMIEGKRREYLMWRTKDGETSASPASQHAMSSSLSRTAGSSEVLLRTLGEVLELPGLATDYHFAILGCVEELWKRRRQEPGMLSEVERLCWIDVYLVEARPSTILFDRDGKSEFARVPAFGHLIQLYEREGFLLEAIEVAQRAERFGAESAVERLRVRLAQVESEVA